MPYKFLDIAATRSVRAAQAANGSRDMWEHFKGHRTFDQFTDNEAAFIAERDSFYVATVSESGWPYVQHRGGPPGFLKVLDEKTLGFADFRGNLQYISLGNVTADDRVALIIGGLSQPRASQDSGAYGGARSRRRARSRRPPCATRLQGEARTGVPVAPGDFRLELPAAHHATLIRWRTLRLRCLDCRPASPHWRQRTRRCAQRSRLTPPGRAAW